MIFTSTDKSNNNDQKKENSAHQFTYRDKKKHKNLVREKTS